MLKKVLSVMLIMTMMGSMVTSLTLPVRAAEPAGDIGDTNALDALGIDTSVMPEGYDANSLENPYGRSTLSLNPVYELFVTGMKAKPIQITTELINDVGDVKIDSRKIASQPYDWQTTLYGHNSPLGASIGTQGVATVRTVTESSIVTTITSPAGIVTSSAIEGIERVLSSTSSASGNFSGAAKDAGKTGQVVTVGTDALDKNGGLYLYFSDPVSTTSGSMKTLLDKTGTIGNTGLQMEEDFINSPYLMQNYLKVTTGDYDKNGIDEVAVYIAEQGNSRVEVYKLETTSSTGEGFFLDESNWKKAWTYHFTEYPYVSNMVSLTSGDFNRDGTDDLAMTWGFYYGPDNSNACQAVVLSGSNTAMLQSAKTIDLNYGTAPIVRASFAFGDIDGDDVKDLVLGGQLATDIARNNIKSRFVAVYTYEGTSDKYLQVAAKNFDLFEKKNGNYVNAVMATGRSNEQFYSSPAMTANVSTINLQGVGQSAFIYLDSLLIENGDQGLVISRALDNDVQFNQMLQNPDGTPQFYYVEYGAAAADFTGSAKQSLQTMQYHLPIDRTTTYRFWDWWYRLLFWPTTVTQHYDGSLDMLRYTALEPIPVQRSSAVDFSTSFCTLNSDNDTTLLKYLNKHYVRYTDPKVLAVLSSPPYFKDLDQDSFSGAYKNSETSYSTSTGSGTSTTQSHTLSVGAYVSFQHEFTVPVVGTKVGSLEAEASYTAGLTWETEHSSSMEQTISYSTLVGEDAVAFYSIPMEIYEFESLVPRIDAAGNISGYDSQYMTVNLPHVAAVKVLPLDTYEKIAADYKDLPRIAGEILDHEVGNPASYPSTSTPYQDAIQYNGDWSGVNFGNGSISQEIAMSDETGKSFTHTHAIDIKVGGGPGDWVFGVTAGYEFGAGKTKLTTSGSSFTGTVYNMPAEAEPYSYGYAWKVFSYLGESRGNTFPVVDYLVTDVTSPPKLPTDFQQNSTGTTASQIELDWSYSGQLPVAGFQLYRYYEFPDGSGSYELSFIPASKVSSVDTDGTRHYNYLDVGLDEYTDYQYQIQALGVKVPNASILSEVLTARTKTGTGYPVIHLEGPTDGVLAVYPDTDSTAHVVIDNLSEYTQTPRYQWQKLTADGWIDVSGAIGTSRIFRAAGLADEGEYRCRVNAIHESKYITSYSETFFLDYEQRTPMIVPGSFLVTDAPDGNGGTISSLPAISISLKSAHANHYYVPTGTLTFLVTGADYSCSFPVALQAASGSDSDSGIATASFIPDKPLPEGVYEISAYYAGSRVYKSLATEKPVAWVSGNVSGHLLTLNSTYTYGDVLHPSLKQIQKTIGGTTSDEITTGISYRVVKYTWKLVLSEPYYFWHWTLTATPVDGFVSPEGVCSAAKAGDYTLIASVGGTDVASRAFSVNQKIITIGITDQDGEAKTSVITHPAIGILTLEAGSMAFNDTFADLGLIVKASDSSGRDVTISSITDPGRYRIVGAPGPNAAVMKFGNYAITFIPGSYILTSTKFDVTGKAKPVNGITAGTLEMLTPVGNPGWVQRFANGTTMVFLATPLNGNSVKRWTISDTDQPANPPILDKTTHSQTLTHLMKSENILVSVEFEVSQKTLRFQATTGGAIACTSSNVLNSGDIARTGAEFSFRATPAVGYHFVEWQLTEVGKGIVRPVGTSQPDGGSTCSLVMGVGDTVLHAIFARDSYLITLRGDLQATYLDDTDGSILTADIPVTVQTGTRIPGDKLVTVTHKPGFIIPEDADWTRDSLSVTSASGVSADNQQYAFTMLVDTVIAVKTENERYDVSVAVTGPGFAVNTVSTTVNGTPRLLPANVSGGSTLTFKANPAYGYVFDHWTLGSPTVTAGGLTLTIPALGGPLNMEAVFADNQSSQVIVLHGLRGSMLCTVNDGTPLSISAPGSNTSVKVFKGDNVIITAIPQPNFMVEYWRINGVILQSTAKTQTFTDLPAASDLTVEAIFGAQSYTTVTYSAGTGGSIGAASDGVSFESGSNSIGNGSTLVFAAAPVAGKMVDGWQLNGQSVLNALGKPLVDPIYTIPALSGSANVVLSFRDIVTHTVGTATTNAAIVSLFSPAWPLGVRDGASAAWPLGVRDGASAVFTVTPDSGYQLVTVAAIQTADGAPVLFDGTVKQADGSWLCTLKSVTTDLTVSAEADKLYTLSVPTAPVGGSILLSTEKALAGEIITLRATPGSGYTFTGWVVSGSVTLGNAAAAVTTFTMPQDNVNVAAVFTKTNNGSNDNGNNGNNGNGGTPAPAPAPIVELEPEAALPGGAAFVFTLGSGRIIPEDSLKLVEANKTQDLLLTGNGFSIRIPAGTLQAGDDLNDYVPNLPGLDLATGAGWVVLRTDSAGGKHIIRWSIVRTGYVAFIVEGRGIYSIFDNSKAFDDIKGHWANRSILFSTARELFSGTGKGKFSTAAFMTRAMLVTVLHRLDGLTGSADAAFTDVPKGQWFTSAVSWAYENKITSGIGKGAFGAGNRITREQLVSILYRYAEHLKLDTTFAGDLSAFPDTATVSPYARDAMIWAVENGLITGRNDKRIDPAGDANRAEVASILERFIAFALK